MNMKWIFKPIAGTNDGKGDEVASSFFRDKGKDFSIGELFARESISNSADQRNRTNADPAKVYIDIIDLLGDPKINFLSAIDWPNLSSHIESSIDKAQGPKKKILKRGLDRVNDGGQPLSLVRVSDFNTEGLTGPEDGRDSSDDEDGNFYLFARATFMTNEAAGTRQGSFGLGKRVFYETSEIDTVLMSSTILDDDGSLKTRSFGRVELTTHNCDHDGTEAWNPVQKWEGPGFFGVDGTYNGQVRADSSINEDPQILDSLFLNRETICSDENTNATGTSVISVAFDEWGAADNKLAHFESEIKKWFWPALSLENKELKIYLRIFDNHNVMKSVELTINEDSDTNWMPYVHAMQNDSNATDITNINNLIEGTIPWIIPPTVEQDESYSHNEVEAEGILKVLKSDSINLTKSNSLALLRNKLCVMNYINIPPPANDDCYLYGVFLAGHALEHKDDHAHNFLRQSEPPLHNDWTYSHKVANFYKFLGSNSDLRSKAALKLQKSIYSKIHTALSDLVAVEAPIDRNNLDDLSAFFNFGKRGGGTKREIDSHILKYSIHEMTLTFNIKISNLKVLKNAFWTAEITSKLKGINGYGKNNLLITSIVPENADHVDQLIISNIKSVWMVKASPELETYNITVSAEVPNYFSESEIPELEPMFNISPD